MDDIEALRAHLLAGQVIPAHPLALDAARTLDERRQRALTRYYVEAGAGGIAVAVHTTQFAIRDPAHGLLEPVLALAAATARESSGISPRPFALVAGAVGGTRQAVAEASLARDLGYDAVLLGLGALRDAADDALVAHCREVADVLPVIGFYLQPAVGGRALSYRFWRRFAAIERVVAVKIAPFQRYATLDVVRGVAEAGRDDVALYTGNDDAIVADLVTPVATAGGVRHVVGGLLGQWAVWTRGAVRLLERARDARAAGVVPASLLQEGAALTDANGALFDVAHGFAGCIAGIHHVLHGQGLLRGTWCLDPREELSPGQAEEIARVLRAYPALSAEDDALVASRLEAWLA
jgi:dihydrodipicolinate synthase/N-acetylneuraminate lyase